MSSVIKAKTCRLVTERKSLLLSVKYVFSTSNIIKIHLQQAALYRRTPVKTQRQDLTIQTGKSWYVWFPVSVLN